MPTEEKWNTGFNPAVTYDLCSYCKEIHYEDKIYYHPYMKKVWVFGLTIEDIHELTDEIKEEIKKGKTTNESLQKRGLDIENIIKEELEEV